MTRADPPPDAPPLFWKDRDVRDPTVVGRSTDALFTLDESGAVWLVPDGPSPPRFVNTTTKAFYRSMALFEPVWRSLGRDDEAAPIVERLAARLGSIDAMAFCDRDSFWPLVLEQVRDGLL